MKDINKVLEMAKKYEFTDEWKELYFRIRNLRVEAGPEFQQLKDDIWALPSCVQTSFIRELAKEKHPYLL